MKATALKYILTGAMMVSFSALAEDAADVNLTKPALGVDFNKMIDGNNLSKSDIRKHIETKIQEEDAEEVSEESRVLDFVDVEVGWGETPNTIVDRRFDSIDVPKLIDLEKLVPSFMPETGI